MPTRIVWMSRHSPTPRQRVTLEAAYPKHTLIIEPKPFSSAEDIIRRFNEVRGDEMVVVAPWTLVRRLVELGIRPLYAEMRKVRCGSAEAEVTIGNRCYKFVRFRRVNGINIEFEDLPELTTA